jgi:acetyl-CoA C-acetyltransferase
VTLRTTEPERPFAWSVAGGAEDGGVPVDDGYVGEVEVETFTVEYDREGLPARGYVIGRTPTGARTGVRVSKSDSTTIAALTSAHDDPIGRSGQVALDGDRRLFSFDATTPG